MAAVSDFRRLFCEVQTRLFSAGFAAASVHLGIFQISSDAPDRDKTE
jgi:hypothetical protein